MKKILLSLTLLALTCTAMSQGTWFAKADQASIAAATNIDLGITGLKCQHSDAAGIVGKSDVGATAVLYNDINYTNESYLQGSTNAMYFAFIPSQSGTLDVSVKMGSAKKTYALKLKDAIYLTTIGNLTELTTDFGLLTSFTADYLDTYPQVYDTYNKTTGIWDGSAAIQSSGSNQYLVMSFPVDANKTYCVGCAGSKLMLRGVNYKLGSSPSAIQDKKTSDVDVFASNGLINIKGLSNEKVSVSDLAGRNIKVVNPAEISVKPGMYFVKINSVVKKIMVK